MAPSRIAAHAHVLARDAHAAKARTVAAPIVVILLVVLLFAAVTFSLIIWLKRRLRAPTRTISPFGMGITLDAGASAGGRDMENVTVYVSPTTPSSSNAGARFNKEAAVSGRASESRKSTLSPVSPTSIHTVGTSVSKRMSLAAVPPEWTKSTILAAPEPESPVALDLQTPVAGTRPVSSQSQSSYDHHLAPERISARATTPTVEDEIELSVQASRLVELQTEIGRVGFSVEELLSSLSRLRASADAESDPDAPPPTYDMRI
ncbi:hypothetical protein EXIGLDRAFT_723290 [Exidia glandulosa HHB12029]|uniref:Uncharacterized protein n=1 Tax=Exidia glandulosa HHB12029 TaxID=1314781 RepID=A0A165EW75_EXIGL|nr:hypothetical protein EXIGLDRAFT_723290 [Exidia glandulosa HHB12029]